MKKFINLTPHNVVLNNGTTYTSKGVARISNTFTSFDKEGICQVVYGDPIGLPEPQEGTVYIVSSMVLSALKGKRDDLVAPATGHPNCVRDEQGHIVSVPGFVR